MTPSPYWTAYADALPDQGTVTLPNGDVKRLVEQQASTAGSAGDFFSRRDARYMATPVPCAACHLRSRPLCGFIMP